MSIISLDKPQWRKPLLFDRLVPFIDLHAMHSSIYFWCEHLEFDFPKEQRLRISSRRFDIAEPECEPVLRIHRHQQAIRYRAGDWPSRCPHTKAKAACSLFRKDVETSSASAFMLGLQEKTTKNKGHCR